MRAYCKTHCYNLAIINEFFKKYYKYYVKLQKSVSNNILKLNLLKGIRLISSRSGGEIMGLRKFTTLYFHNTT